MCIVCTEFGKGRITNKEAIGAFREMIMTANESVSEDELLHMEEVRADLYMEIYEEELELSKESK